MSSPLRVAIVIPALNEAATVGNLVSTLKKIDFVDDILVVDDGSSDDTASVAAAHGARVISHRAPLGNGASVKTGLRNTTAEWIVIIDADGQHRVEDVTTLASFPETVDLAVGARPFRWSRFRDFGNLFLSNTASLLCGRAVPDLTSGLRRIHRTKALQFIDLYPQGFSFPSTSTILFITSYFGVEFFPIENKPRLPHASKSKLKPFRDGFKFLTIIYRIIMLSYPLKFFVPLSIACFAFGVAWVIKTMILTSQVSAAGALSILSGLTLLLFGTIADQLSQLRRMIVRLK